MSTKPLITETRLGWIKDTTVDEKASSTRRPAAAAKAANVKVEKSQPAKSAPKKKLRDTIKRHDPDICLHCALITQAAERKALRSPS